MKWLKGVAATLVVTLLTTLLLAALQRPISNMFAANRLRATVEIGPWFPLSTTKDPLAEPNLVGVGFSEVTRLASADFPMARINVENSGSKEVKQIKLRFGGVTEPYVAIPKQEKIPYQFLSSRKNLSLPNLGPGERVVFYLWNPSGFGYPWYLDGWRSYSSEGPWRLEMRSPTPVEEALQTPPLERFIFEWLYTIIMLLVFGLLVVATIGLYINFTYARDLLADKKFYGAEQARYDADPDNFKVRLSALGDFMRHHSLERFRRKAPKTKKAPDNSRELEP